jgi:ATP-dependent Clp protease ATP-binding subunit ClpC
MTTAKNNTFVVVDHTELSTAEQAFSERFSGRVINQPGALKVAQMAHNLYKNPLRDKTLPIGIFYLVGQSRTGKSLVAVALAEHFHNDGDALTRIAASDYIEKHQVLDLKGAAPTFIGYVDPRDPKNQLQDHEIDPLSVISPHNLRRVRLESGEEVNIVVIEEFEKASKDFYKFWMGAFDKGGVRLGNGVWVDFTNTIFILTSNLGMEELERMETPMGFRTEDRKITVKDVENVVNDAMKRTYKPEFRNRLDAVVIFQPHTDEAIRKITNAEVALVQKRINAQMPAGEDFVLEVTDEAKQFMLRTVDNNVAELKRVLNRAMVMPLGRLLDTKKLSGGDIVKVTVNAAGDALEFSVAKNAFGVSEHEKTIRKMGKRQGTVNLSLQREVRKATLNAKKDGVQEWHVMTPAAGKNRMSEVAVELLNTMENVLELEVTNVSYQRVAPFIFSAVVLASKEQINLLVRLHEEDGVSVNPTSKKLLPAR